MNFTRDKTLQVKPSVCFGQCTCEDLWTLHSVGPNFPNQNILSMDYSFGEVNLGYHPFSEGRTLSERKAPLQQHKWAPQIMAPKPTGPT